MPTGTENAGAASTAGVEALFRASGAQSPGFTLARLPGDGSFIEIDGNLVYARETVCMAGTVTGEA